MVKTIKRKPSAKALQAKTLDDLTRARQAILALAGQLTEQQGQAVFLGVWSAQDLLAHLSGWDETNLQACRQVLAGELPDFYQHIDRDFQTYNARLVSRLRQPTYALQLGAAKDSHDRLMVYLQALPAEDFVRDTGLQYKGWRVTVLSLIRAEAKDETEHARQLQAHLTTFRINSE